jgi:hypothetical protein
MIQLRVVVSEHDRVRPQLGEATTYQYNMVFEIEAALPLRVVGRAARVVRLHSVDLAVAVIGSRPHLGGTEVLGPDLVDGLQVLVAPPVGGVLFSRSSGRTSGRE